MRPAFTIIELLVAICVFTIGVLALAATAGFVATQVGDGASMSHASHAARSVIDSLATRPCSTLVAGSAIARGTPVDWTIGGDSLAALVDVRVRMTTRRGDRSRSYQALVPCRAP